VRLLVSVRNAAEARAALEGGADIIDAKEPTRGALGAVSPDALNDILACVAGRRPVSAALGDGKAARRAASETSRASAGGVAFVKVGFSGVRSVSAATELLLEIAAASAGAAVVAVAYADWIAGPSLPPTEVLTAAIAAGASGVLLDTAGKEGRGLFDFVRPEAIRVWTRAAMSADLQVALAGSLTTRDFADARATGASVVGVRGAACVGGRTGTVSAELVRQLSVALRGGSPYDPAKAAASSESTPITSARTPSESARAT